MASRTARPQTTLQSYVLHRYDWSESSLILDLFTREQGRLAVAAKGAKRPYSQLRAVLLPFQRLHVTLSRGRVAPDDPAPPEVQTLRGAEWAGGAAMLTGSALFAGFHCNELLMKLLARHDPHPRLFDAYAHTLPDLSLVTLTQRAVREHDRLALLPEAGVAEAQAISGSVPGTVMIGAQAALEHGSVDALRQVCSAALPELKAMLRTLLHYHLGTPTLRTRQVMLDLQMINS